VRHVARGITSFSLELMGTSTASEVYLHAASPPRAATLVYVIPGTRSGSHVSTHFWYLVVCILQ
jgi:hypothetical protein